MQQYTLYSIVISSDIWYWKTGDLPGKWSNLLMIFQIFFPFVVYTGEHINDENVNMEEPELQMPSIAE